MKIRMFFKIYFLVSILILILQLVPYLFIGNWYGYIHNYAISPIIEWLESLDSRVLPVICASVIASLIIGLLLMILWGLLSRIFLKGKK